MNLDCHNNLKSCNMNHTATVITFSQASCVNKVFFFSLYYPLSNAEMQNPLAVRHTHTHTHTFHVILFAQHNQANVKGKDSSVGLHLNAQCKSVQMNGANHILEVVTSTEVR